MESTRRALLGTLLVALASSCGARTSLSLHESSVGAGGATSSVSTGGGAASVSSGGVTTTASSGGGAGGNDACASVVCDTPPSACHSPKGICNDGVCSYPLADGATCDDGDACTGKDTCANGVCAGAPLSCDTPPPASCVSPTTLHVWITPGTCSAGTCGYQTADVVCPAACSDGACEGVVKASKIAAGTNHTCAVTSNGTVQCWGLNELGELGNDSTFDSHVPVDIVGLPPGIVSVVTGNAHTCALTAAGAVKCWGANVNGRLGNNSMVDSHVPVDVVGLSSGVLGLSAGGDHTCAVTSAGAVECWGSNLVGQLGNGTTTDSYVPVQVVGLSSGVVSVSAASQHTCVVTASGGVKCWGVNTSGELGNGSTTDSHVPVDVVGGLAFGVATVVAGDFDTCAVTVNGALKCWGNNYSGQLGNNSMTDSAVPVDVMGLGFGVLGVSTAGAGACAITFAGGVRCWGTNGFGQLGDGTTTDSHVPVDVVGLWSGVVAIDSGEYDTCVITNTGALKCWGWNFYGQLGNGSTTNSQLPFDVIGF